MRKNLGSTGEYAICHVIPSGDPGCGISRVLRSGFSSYEAADDAVADVASELGVAWQECAIFPAEKTDSTDRPNS